MKTVKSRRKTPKVKTHEPKQKGIIRKGKRIEVNKKPSVMGWSVYKARKEYPFSRKTGKRDRTKKPTVHWDKVAVMRSKKEAEKFITQQSKVSGAEYKYKHEKIPKLMPGYQW